MRKILLALLLIMLTIAPIFATNGPQDKDPATLKVTTEVGPKRLYGFLAPGENNFGGEGSTNYDNIDGMFLTKTMKVYSSNASILFPNQFYVGVKTNSADKVSITLKHTDLKSGENTIPVTINITGGTKFTASQEIPILTPEKDTETGARVILREFGLTFDSTNAAAGTYYATITMTVTGA